MTIVMAKRFGVHIEVVADTMITDDAQGRQFAFPGRLKIITLATDLTVAYAGHAAPALHAIRTVFSAGERDPSRVAEILRQVTASSDHDVEFLLVSHRPAAELRRIWAGTTSQPLDQAAIGNTALRSAVHSAAAVTGDHEVDAKEFGTAFLEALTNPRLDPGAGVGGLAIRLRATPFGHFYRFYHFNHSWKAIEFQPGVTQYQDSAEMQTGDWTFHHTVLPPLDSGIAVLAAQVPQARRAYIYDPLTDDDAREIVLLGVDVDWTEHQERMNEIMRAALDDAIARRRAANQLIPRRATP